MTIKEYLNDSKDVIYPEDKTIDLLMRICTKLGYPPDKVDYGIFISLIPKHGITSNFLLNHDLDSFKKSLSLYVLSE